MAAVRASTGVPYVAVLVTSALFWILTLSGTFVYLATFSIIARLVGYASTCAALPVLRRRSVPRRCPCRRAH
jgi:amino acid transporter